ncbi:rod shape-determining protein MreD [Nocardioides sp. ChNu-153]|uniref:rod shape-determining protein MreD n=1 Tax=unclassified Nocardioides TaxID=2615069 RepID=UPI0024071C30|nr:MULTISPECIES: rod shape-determining protein MreD [unclassified Nocardioides]MDF9716296.1 rod shape-determining protein MreD [Nocardioides sp. ChNu-99]MDN7122742.1 rod shape-determining protein MreD [Nocardioides sp. ChNu-153]
MTALRTGVTALAVLLAIVLQAALLPHVGWRGVVPNLCLLVVVAGALTRGAHFGVVLGFCAGLALDLAPPADHLAGRWALALMAVGLVAGLVRRDERPTIPVVLVTAAVASFVGASVFGLLGVVTGDPGVAVTDVLLAVVAGVAGDLIVAPLVLLPLMVLLTRFEPQRRLA